MLKDFVQIDPHAIPNSKNWMRAQFLSHYLTILDTKIIFALVSNLKKVLNLTSYPIIIHILICSFQMFLTSLNI